MPTTTALTTLPDEPSARRLADALETIDPAPVGVGVFEIEDGSGRWEVGAYFDAAPDEVVLALMAAAHGAAPFAVSALPEVDWVAHVKRELHPVEAGRFWLYGSHDAGRVPAGRVGLMIEATVAFGTGHHGTTAGCLIAFERMLGQGHAPARVADIGCGTGVLALAAAAVLPGAAVLASDIDAVAVEVALANAAVNGMAGRVACLEAAGFDHPAIAAAAPFDLIFANILKGPLIDLAPDIAAHLAPGGHAILSGLLAAQAADVLAAYVAQGLSPVARDDLGDWAALTLKKD
ncbi:MAG: 50S ribosomal protein L11 methyltransferase [Gemmobacter sp.]